MLLIETRLAASPIHGLGVFAAGPVAAGTVVSRFLPPFDMQFTSESIPTLPPVAQDYLRRYAYRSTYTGLHILTGDNDRFMNHSETPNVGMNPDGSVTTIALCDIAADEEFTCDYRTFDADWKSKLPGA